MEADRETGREIVLEADRETDMETGMENGMENNVQNRRIALLSNVNMNAVIRILRQDVQVYETEGYGNELGILKNPASSYHAFRPEVTFLVLDLMELLGHETEQSSAKTSIKNWFSGLETALAKDCIYYISDACLWGVELEVAGAGSDLFRLEALWDDALHELCGRHANVRILPYHRLITKLGEENAFSAKMWYMGRILLSGEAGKRLAALILDRVRIEYRTPKKVLALDLDNTLWGGLAGEHDENPVVLSEEHTGLAYKNLQRVILQMQRHGVLLVIVSKNNEEDAREILERHPHMVLRPEHFVAMRINWKTKDENLRELAKELNLGLDSFVFWDDNPQERLLVSRMLPEVTVPEFPGKAEDLAPAMTGIYHTYFEKAAYTAEDLEKTLQYADNARRNRLQQDAVSFEDYLRQLQIVVTRVDAAEHVNRLTDMLNKTNQFNLTTRRHTVAEVQALIADAGRRIFLYRVEDCFGDYGVVAALIVDASGKIPVIEEFVMSCRIMGKNIEQGILTHVESCLRTEGFACVRGLYIPTAKNKPVEELYPGMGYVRTEAGGCAADGDGICYELSLEEPPDRAFAGELRENERGNEICRRKSLL